MIEYLPYFISAGSLGVSFIVWRDKRSESNRSEVIKLEEKLQALQVRASVLEERVLNEIRFSSSAASSTSHALDKLNEKLDEIICLKE